MRRTLLRAVLMTGAAFVSLPFLGAPVAAHDFRAGDLAIDHPWTRAVGAAAPTAAGYMVIRNTGAAPDRLVSAETPRAARIEMHEMSVTDGIMRMRPIAGGIPLPPGGEVRLAPGGLHLMLIGPQGGFEQGARVPVTLVFEHAGRITVELAVDAPGGRGTAPHQGH
ncbi:copper chaperone PCu(A)C [Paeniroseomonas aquatica]|uniref:Copper chaperone PCu(A)C n=1 Tax=Paeniroseomonas aquatica TaxID=373043 RepID=A0ABT7ZZV3_9PROT|nr:copper chaperone PCu(A)C [Paeniroseomonas aquatica]MDN3562891.1 copper chaperone PCu(A)C [Paeniroseomonas aquatica]